MEIKFPRERMAAASFTGSKVNLESITMLDGRFSTTRSKWNIDSERIDVCLPYTYIYDDQLNQLHYTKKLAITSTDDKLELITATYHVLYKLTVNPPPEELRDAFFGSFCEISGLHHIWPYWREFVSDAFQRMGLQRPPLPCLRITASSSDKEKTKQIKQTVTSKKKNKQP